MERATFIYMLIEAIVFLVPLATLFIKVGGYKKMLDDIDARTKNYTEWKAKQETKVSQLELQTIAQQNTLVAICVCAFLNLDVSMGIGTIFGIYCAGNVSAKFAHKDKKENENNGK